MSQELGAAKSRAIFEQNTRRGGAVLLILAIVLTAAAVGASVPLTGFAALMTVFAGGIWFSYRMLLARWARFRNLPITKLNRM